MKVVLSLLPMLSLCLSLHGQKTQDWLKPGAILDIFHAKLGPYAERDSVIDFLNNEYMPVMAEAFPQTYAFHIEGIDGDRKGQHVKFWVFSSTAVRDSYFPVAGGRPTDSYITHNEKASRQVSTNKMIELFRGWDFDFKTDWKIVGATEARASLEELPGLVMDVHYLAKKQNVSRRELQNHLATTLQQLKGENSQFFLLYGDRDTRKGTYAILELHAPGESKKEQICSSGLVFEGALFSSYRIW